MACFIAPTTAALLTQAIKKKIPARFHIEWLLTMLWGGAAWLIAEHIYHGEVVFYPPFFTAGADTIISEVLSIGFTMVTVLILIWGLLLQTEPLHKKRSFITNP